MPRKPRLLSPMPVRVLREATGLSQSEFADLVGVSTGTVQSLELNRLNLSPQVKRRIARATGCDPRTLDELAWDGPESFIAVPPAGAGVRVTKRDHAREREEAVAAASKRHVVLTAGGAPYTREFFDAWQKRERESKPLTLARCRYEAREAASRLTALLTAAAEHGSYEIAFDDFWAWLDGARGQLGPAVREAALRLLRKQSQGKRQAWEEFSPPGTRVEYSTQGARVVKLHPAERRPSTTQRSGPKRRSL